MSPHSESSEAIVLRRSPHGEKMHALDLFSPDLGLITAYWRIPTKVTTSYSPDLFDRAQWELKFKLSDRHAFVQEFNLIERQDAIASHYRSFVMASEFAGLLRKNLSHAEFYPPIYELALKAIVGFCKGIHPEAIFLKAAFQFARDEGYPVREQWLRGLPAHEQEAVIKVLRSPVEAIDFSPEKVEQMRQDFLHYLVQHTDFYFG